MRHPDDQIERISICNIDGSFNISAQTSTRIYETSISINEIVTDVAITMMSARMRAFTVVLILLFLLSIGAGSICGVSTSGASSSGLTTVESQIVDKVNGTGVYDYDLELERIAFNHTLSGYSFRSSGSRGANATVDWLMQQFETLGLEAHKEQFQLTTWDLPTKPTLIIDEDGNLGTESDQTWISSFQSIQYSWPTPPGGVFSDLVVLPLPTAANRSQIGKNPINQTEWNAVNTTGKIVLVGREVRFSSSWEESYKEKLTTQTPFAVVYTWWYDWMAFVPDFFSATDLPTYAYYWNLSIPVGFVNYAEGSWIKTQERELNVSARVDIEAVVSLGPHYNVVGKLQGTGNPEEFVIVSCHYDTVMCSGFGDNGAGTAGVLEMARIFAEAYRTGLLRPKYTVLFVAFAGEEIGLVGAINYVIQHKIDMNNIVAVLNLDTIGCENLAITNTNAALQFNLNQLVSKAAEDIGIKVVSDDPGGSDDVAFSDPAGSNEFYRQWWKIDAGIANATPVSSSICIFSYPSIYSEKWDPTIRTPGWMHTSYDNSTSTSTFGWEKPINLENQLSVVALSLARIVTPGVRTRPNLSKAESDVVDLMDGPFAYDCDLKLEQISLNTSMSGYSFRSSGSAGANESAKWIKEQFESFGLETTVESYEFTTWNLPSKPTFTIEAVIDSEGKSGNMSRDPNIVSFQVEHYSLPATVTMREVCYLPVPEVANLSTLLQADADGSWGGMGGALGSYVVTKTTGKIVLLPKEVRLMPNLWRIFTSKISAEPPAAVIFTWVNSWISWAPQYHESVGGLPPGNPSSPVFWHWQIPVGSVDYDDGLWIRNILSQGGGLRMLASVDIPAVITTSPHKNIVGKLASPSQTHKNIIVCGHYDTVTTAGFCSNGAGIAGVIELAAVFSEAAKNTLFRSEYTILFIAFAGGELGSRGMIEYIRQHQEDLKNTVAVLNLDSIGSEELEVSQTWEDDNGLNLCKIILNAADDLGVATVLTTPDVSPFRNPIVADDLYRLFWQSSSGIRDLPRLKSTVTISSYPLFDFNSWTEEEGRPVMIHTTYDNSTSAANLNWLTPSRLGVQVQAVALSIMRIGPPTLSSIYIVAGVSAAIAIIAALIVVYSRSARMKLLFEDIRHELDWYIGFKGLIYTAIFVAICMSVSLVASLRLGIVEVIGTGGYPEILTYQYLGWPFEMIAMARPRSVFAGLKPDLDVPVYYQTGTGPYIFIPGGFILNSALFILTGLALTYAIIKIKARREERALLE